MITYTYTVLSLHKEDVTVEQPIFPPTKPAKEYKDFVVSTVVKISGKQDSKTIDIERAASFPLPPYDNPTFIDYTNLSEQDVIDWYCDGIRNIQAENDIKKLFELEAGTKVDSNFPWD